MSRRIINDILLGLMALLAPAVLAGCVYDSYDEPDPEEKESVIYLTLNVDVADGFGAYSRHTRAGDYYYEEPVRQNEKMNDLHVFIVDENNGLEAWRDLYFDGSDSTPASLTFKLGRGNKKVFLFANEASFPTELKDIFSNLYQNGPFPEHLVSGVLIQRAQNAPVYTLNQDIPMCESFDFVLNPPTGQEVTYVNADVFVTRVAVKYTFISRFDVDKVTVGLNNMATAQYFFPNSATYNPGKYQAPEVINGIPGRNIISFSAPKNPQLSTCEIELTGKTEIELEDETGAKTKAYRYDPIYLMETPGTSFSMTIRVESEGYTGPWYDPKTLPNLPLLPRNTHVVVYMGMNFGVNFDVDVVPYRGCILNPYFGLDPNRQ